MIVINEHNINQYANIINDALMLAFDHLNKCLSADGVYESLKRISEFDYFNTCDDIYEYEETLSFIFDNIYKLAEERLLIDANIKLQIDYVVYIFPMIYSIAKDLLNNVKELIKTNKL